MSQNRSIHKHRWSGWPGAWCLECGLEDRTEVELVGEGGHRYSPERHTAAPCAGCSDDIEGCKGRSA
jgi:hypothetical protein